MILTLDEVKGYLNIKSTSRDDVITALIPSTEQFVSKYIKKELTPLIMDDALRFATAKLLEFFMLKTGIKSEAIARKNTSYSESIPSYLTGILDQYIDEATAPSNPVRFF